MSDGFLTLTLQGMIWMKPRPRAATREVCHELISLRQSLTQFLAEDDRDRDGGACTSAHQAYPRSTYPESPEDLEAIAQGIKERYRHARHVKSSKEHELRGQPNMEDPEIWRVHVRVSCFRFSHVTSTQFDTARIRSRCTFRNFSTGIHEGARVDHNLSFHAQWHPWICVRRGA